jgi:hypothetical protein
MKEYAKRLINVCVFILIWLGVPWLLGSTWWLGFFTWLPALLIVAYLNE